MRRWRYIIFLIFGIFMLGCIALAEEDYMTDSGEIREVEDGEAMTDSGEIEDVGDSGEYMTDSGEVEDISGGGDTHDDDTDFTGKLEDDF